MQFQVPQNVRRADTIIGPITFVQLAILLVGGGLSYAWYMILANTYYWYVWIWPVGLTAALTLALAFLKIGDMNFFTFILYMIEFLVKPRIRHWRKGDMEYYQSVLTPISPVSKQSEEVVSLDEEKMEKRKKLKELTEILDQP